MSKRLVILAVLVLFVLSCGITFNTGEAPQAPQQPVIVTQIVPVPASAVPPSVAPVQPVQPVAPVPVTDPPMVTANESVDCLPYPSFHFTWMEGLEPGKTVPVFAKAEPQLSESGVDWYEVKWNNGRIDLDCWVYGGFVTKSGDFSQINVKHVNIPYPPPKNHCDTAARIAKMYVGMKVWLPWQQRPYLDKTQWFEGMSDYSGQVTHIRPDGFMLVDNAGCYTVYVDGNDYPWRIRDLLLSKP